MKPVDVFVVVAAALVIVFSFFFFFFFYRSKVAQNKNCNIYDKLAS